MSDAEEWRAIPGHGRYEASSRGRVRSNGKHGRGVMAPWDNKRGYWCLALWLDGRRVRRPVHRLVALAFVANPHRKPEVNHKDGDRANNTPGNLEWADRSEQMRHVYHQQRSSPLCRLNGHATEVPDE